MVHILEQCLVVVIVLVLVLHQGGVRGVRQSGGHGFVVVVVVASRGGAINVDIGTINILK